MGDNDDGDPESPWPDVIAGIGVLALTLLIMWAALP
jgi:hypothetical protein